MNLAAAVAGGVRGTMAFTAIILASRKFRISHPDYARMLGEFILPPGKSALAFGLALHLLNGVAFGLVYMAIMTWLGFGPDAPGGVGITTLEGLLFGVYHFLMQIPLVGIAGRA